MYAIWKKQTVEKTPLFLKIGVIVGGWVALSPLINNLRTGKLDLFAIFMGVAQIILLVAIWNLRKWAVIAFALLAVIGLVGAALVFGKLSAIVIGIVLFARAIVIVPSLFSWKRMT